jgi:hypothetical protein
MPKAGDVVKTIIFDGEHKITSAYGARIHPITGKADFHKGWDFSMVVGTKLKAPADGRFTWGTNDGFGGQYGKLQRTDGTWDYFFHCSTTIAPNGAVKKGQYICKSGNTGNSTGAHLHWERRKTSVSTSHFNDIDSIIITTPPMATPYSQSVWNWCLKYRPDVCKVYTVNNVLDWWVTHGAMEVPVQYDNLFKENENLKQQVTALSAELSRVSKQLATTALELTNAQGQVEMLNGNIEALESSLQENKTQYEKDKEELEAQVAREENKNKLLKEQNEVLETNNANQSKLIEELETKIENQREIIVRLEKKLANCETSMSNAVQTLIKKMSDFIINLLPKKK